MGTQVLIINASEASTFEEERVHDVLQIITGSEVSLWTRKARVKAIREERFRRRKEALEGDRSRQDAGAITGTASERFAG